LISCGLMGLICESCLYFNGRKGQVELYIQENGWPVAR
jgi:hypothetical protein